MSNRKKPRPRTKQEGVRKPDWKQPAIDKGWSSYYLETFGQSDDQEVGTPAIDALRECVIRGVPHNALYTLMRAIANPEAIIPATAIVDRLEGLVPIIASDLRVESRKAKFRKQTGKYP